MAQITLKGNAIHTVGELPQTGTSAKNFELTGGDLSSKSLQDFAVKKCDSEYFPKH